jgi:hypothetical protein
MICGDKQFIEETGQTRFCTVNIDGPNGSTNHDMPGSDNQVDTPHRSGEWFWFTRYDLIGPIKPYVENTCWECDEPFPEFQRGNIIPFKATTKAWEMNLAYRCKKCWELFQCIESRLSPLPVKTCPVYSCQYTTEEEHGKICPGNVSFRDTPYVPRKAEE